MKLRYNTNKYNISNANITIFGQNVPLIFYMYNYTHNHTSMKLIVMSSDAQYFIIMIFCCYCYHAFNDLVSHVSDITFFCYYLYKSDQPQQNVCDRVV